MGKIIRIGHASQPEGGGVNGSAGDSTKKEVVIVENYDVTVKGYHVLLRPKRTDLAVRSAKACEEGCRNDNIGYSQFGSVDRNSLYKEAVKVGFDLTKVSNKCNTDCSAFMTVCAIAGGANLTYGSNGCTTTTLRTRFKSSGDYLVYTKEARPEFFNSADYLKRGDILVKEGSHTIMVLGYGSMITSDMDLVEEVDEVNLFADFFAIKIDLNTTEVNTNNATATAKITKVEGTTEKALNDKAMLNKYKWTYKLEQLDNNKKVVSDKLKVSSSKPKFSLTSLTPNSSYALKVSAKSTKGGTSFSSPSIIFTTKKNKPTSIKNLKVDFKADNKETCTVSFNAPTSWGSASKRGYRTSLILNGRTHSYNDSIIKATSSKVKKIIRFTAFDKKLSIKSNDLVQISIQPWIKTKNGELITDNTLMVCSQPFYFKTGLKIIDKTYIKIGNNFKQTVVYNMRKD